MRPPDLPEGVDARPAPWLLRRRLLVLAGIVAVVVVILLATIPVTSVLATSAPFSLTVSPTAQFAGVGRVNTPATCGSATGNRTAGLYFEWSVESGQRLRYFNFAGGPPPAPIWYWSNDTSNGSFHFYGLCGLYYFAAAGNQPETVQFSGTWNYRYSVTGPILWDIFSNHDPTGKL